MLPYRILKAELLLLLTALIWGFAFVAQRMGMDHVGPLTYNAARFWLGALSLLPLVWLMQRRTPAATQTRSWRSAVGGGLLAGLLLFTGATLQQIGIVHTTAGKAGFITGLYVVIVPALGMLWGQQASWSAWAGAALAAAGLYLLTMSDVPFSLSQGDGLVLIGAFFWAGHVLVIGWLSGRYVEPILLAFLQFFVCAVLSLLGAVLTETSSLDGLRGGLLPILYGGLLSVGVAFTLQVVAQRDAPPTHAAIILSTETVFAALGGWLLLHETLSSRSVLGCIFMFGGMLLSQWGLHRSTPAPLEMKVKAEAHP